ncbi:MAG: molybdopterin-dependent oxidoreductase [Candidatus Bathyarchaeia archaeon]
MSIRPEKSTNVVKTVCHRDCPDTCFVDVIVEDGRIVSTRGSKENPITQGFLCPRGVGDPKRVYSKERILYPHVNNGDKFGRVSWSDALELVARELTSVLENYGNESVLLYDYAGNQGCLSLQFSQRLWRALGVTVTDGALCSTSGHTGIGLHYGLTYGLGFEEVLNCGTILFWGNNARVSSPHLWALSLRARKEKNATLISIDPRKSETSESCDLWVNPRPGSDVALSYGIARWLIEHDKLAEQFIEEWTTGYDKFKEEAKSWTPSRVESSTNLPWKRVEELCELLVEKLPVCFMIGLGLNKSSHGAEAVRAVSLLPALLGQHRGFHYSDSRGRFIDWGYMNGSKMSSRSSKIVEQVSVGSRLSSGEFKFVFIKGSNPASTLPNQNAVRAGLSREDVFVVVHETHWTETAKLADVVLPAATYLEKSDLNFSDHHPYTRFSAKAVEPLGECKHEVWIMQQLAERMSCRESWVFEDPWQALQKSTAESFENGRFDDLFKGEILKLRQRPTKEYQTPSGKIELYSSKAHEIGANPLPAQLPPKENESWFTLLNSSLPNWTHSQFRDVYGPIPEIVWINPADAGTLGIENGDDVTIFNEFGALTVEAIITENVSKGVLWSPRPLTGKNGVPLNSLASSNPQILGAGPRFNSIRVKIKTS